MKSFDSGQTGVGVVVVGVACVIDHPHTMPNRRRDARCNQSVEPLARGLTLLPVPVGEGAVKTVPGQLEPSVRNPILPNRVSLFVSLWVVFPHLGGHSEQAGLFASFVGGHETSKDSMLDGS